MPAEFCQSCGMPMGGAEFGTEADGNKSGDFCDYCYRDGKFTSEVTMEQMIDMCVAPMVESVPDMTEEKARNIMQQFLPTLKRWK